MFKSRFTLTRLEHLKVRTQSFQLPGWRSAGTRKKAYAISTGALTGIALWAMAISKSVLTEPPQDIKAPTGTINDKVLSGLTDPHNGIAVRDKPTTRLLLSLAIYKACSVKWLID